MGLTNKEEICENSKITTKVIVHSTISDPHLSLCIPTNGVAKWVFPVLDSIYSQNVDENLYEVVVMDNGSDNDFQLLMTEYAHKHTNLTYSKTDAYEFLSEIETYKWANGKFIKFVNHRTQLLPGTLKVFVDFSICNEKDKPEVYFSNGELKKQKKEVIKVNSFDQYVKTLSYFSGWSTGMGFWKSNFINLDLSNPNFLFPHTNILFSNVNNSSYIIDNRILLYEMPTGTIPKGKYNLFNAFAVEYMNLILQLLEKHQISIETFLSIKKDNFEFISSLYLDYIIRKKPCSYDLSDYQNSLNCFYSYKYVRFSANKMFAKKFCKKTLHIK